MRASYIRYLISVGGIVGCSGGVVGREFVSEEWLADPGANRAADWVLVLGRVFSQSPYKSLKFDLFFLGEKVLY
jgi:hypothetical protein